MRRLTGLVCGLVWAACPALAAAGDGPLPPGKPAGVTQAQDTNMRLFYIITAAGTVVLIAGAIWELKKGTAAAAAPAPAVSTAT